MGDFNHGHIQWNSLESTGIEDQQFLFLIQDSFLTQHVLEPTRGENVLDIVLSSQKELVDNVKIFEPLGNSDHNQIHFDINVKSESKNKKMYKRNFHKGNYKDMRKYLAKLDWNNILMNKTAIECWNILKYEIESIIDKFVPFQKQGKRCRLCSTVLSPVDCQRSPGGWRHSCGCGHSAAQNTDRKARSLPSPRSCPASQREEPSLEADCRERKKLRYWNPTCLNS